MKNTLVGKALARVRAKIEYILFGRALVRKGQK